MKRDRRSRKRRKIEHVMYGFTFLLCIVTAAAVIWLLGDGSIGDSAGGNSGQVAEMGDENRRQAQALEDAALLPHYEDGETDWGTEGSNAFGAAGKAGHDGDGAGNRGNNGDGAGNSGSNGTGAEGAAGAEPGTAPLGEAETSVEKPEITLVMAGDILLHTPVAESGKRESGGYDFSAVFAEMKEEIASADLALVNQEVILGGEELGVSGYPAFNAPYELGDALVETGFDVVLHATNHALDKGKRGLTNCLSFWEENYPEIAVLGIHGSARSQEEIYVYEQEGIRLAILNYTYGTNGIALPEDMPYGVDLLNRERVAEDLQRARELADFVVVCPHWGTEYVLEETAEQREWASFFAENGADLILGTHPHVIEPVVWINGPEPEMDDITGQAAEAGEEAAGTEKADTGAPCNVNPKIIPAGAVSLCSEENREVPGINSGTLVYYSLGNFVNWTSGTGAGVANRMVGGMARVTIGLDGNGEAVITSYGVEPLVCHVEQGFGGVRVYPLDRYTEELAARNEIIDQDSQFSLDYCQKLVRNVFGTLVDK